MASHQFRFKSLPPNVQHSIFTYFNGKEIFHPVMKVSKLFNAISNEPCVFATVVFNHFKIPVDSPLYALFCKLSPKERKFYTKECVYTTTERIELFSYYTDGGISFQDHAYFISNIYKENATNLYSTVVPNNANVKSLLSNSIQQKYSFEDIKLYQTTHKEGEEPLEYIVPYNNELPLCDLSFLSTFGVIKYFDLNRTLSNYTCYLKSWVLFVAIDEIDSKSDIVELFNKVDTMEKAKALGFDTFTLVDSAGANVVEFNLSSIKNVEAVLKKHRGMNARLNNAYPLLYGDVTKSAANYLNVIQRVGFRHVLLKLVDSFKEGDKNIDCYNISVSGTIVKMRSNTEE